ncbi:hypothetical protein [Cellvibrio sp.]|uniref:hypothetical protein n=1 Tax=Cellvibrio sp. TaxID=1965322 RepID=UPI00396478E1
MKTFKLKASSTALVKDKRLSNLGNIDIDQLHEVATSLLHRGMVGSWSNAKDGEAVFYLEGKEYFTRYDFIEAARSLPDGNHLVIIEVFSKRISVSLENINDNKISIENRTIMDDISLQKYIRRLLALDYSGNVDISQKENNWRFYERQLFNSRGGASLDPFVCVVKDWGLSIELKLDWILDGTYSLNVIAKPDSDSQL